MDLGLRRLLVVVLSIIGGVALVYVMFFLLNIAYKANITVESYGTEYFVLSALPLALLVGLWLDYFMRTGMIPEDEGKAAAPAKSRPARGSQAVASPAAEPAPEE